MSLKDKLLSSYLTFQENQDFDNSIHDIKDAAIKVFEENGFPTKKDENWKYTSLNSLVKDDYSLVGRNEDAVEFRDVKKYFLNDIDTYKIVFIDGKYSSYLSETTHDGVDVCLLSAALTKPKYKPVIDKYFDKIVKTDSLTSLNTAFASEGAYIYVPKNKTVSKPIQIVHFSTGVESNLMLQPRNLVVVEENSEVQIIERHQSLNSNPVFTNSVTEIFSGNYARVDYYKIQNDKDQASLIDNTHIDQQTSSEVAVHTFSFGGKLTRNNLNFYQNGEHNNSILKGVTIIEDKQHVDHNTLVHHKQPNCESHQDYKGIFDDRATGVFNGKVVVDAIAQKINAYQSNNNILVSDKASINSKPQLEIFADDVRCSHGCTIGQLDEDALFYMKTRGIGEKEGRALLMYAFANNVLESVKIPQLKSRITKLIANKLGVNLGFDV
ncbi:MULTISPECIES: Fe-S cluster assembly protein SufD [unclassified Leeuwenhoekiella]|uniref:Fe-S cluster assembly protein SufD n=1 Tax=unclassified Leeuwenhoekiella TaxID=2615029 RepID=UPI000C599BD4|nr:MULTISPECIES: Fe-S cluster assembly protein SufD [unclassified Leeuwenhoekiella]MAW94181.1 Fe-S cluster assembly protein SufD [Leeuwenhoekiella sp.]MAW96235.1 Fe-S cluster assembly protein SufD [Leeuwenhoekiella sp.]MBA80229.1 Fe-S cluster assembly protein SufD [Leeuwenhoekiella sp.]|tara:strand:+ start:17739 stop:19052 length:1314 start_codon:yes stop_codon:yes gene_type:complete